MGRVFADTQAEPCVALAVLDFHFLTGDPLHPNVLLLFKFLQPGDQLGRFCQALPIGFELRQVRLEEVTQFATESPFSRS